MFRVPEEVLIVLDESLMESRAFPIGSQGIVDLKLK